MAQRSFQDRTILVTGAAGGLGQALCRRFAAEGARIAAVDVAEEPLKGLEQSLNEEGAICTCAQVDLTDEAAVQEAVSLLELELGAVDTLICNAGITHLKNFAHDQSSAVRRVMDVNFFGSVHATAACLPSVTKNRGMIIAVSSVAGFAPLVGRTGYCASKHALHGFYDTLRCELRQTGVDVMLVCPSYIATDIRKDYAADPADGKGQVVGRESSPEEVADQIVQAARRRRREVAIGRVGRFSWWCRRFAPRLFERLMLRNIRDEP